MEVKLAQYTNKGMNKDLSISKSSDEFAYNNENIRITTIGRESLLSVTNEKGSTYIPITGITNTIPVNLFKYQTITKKKDGYYLVFSSDYKFEKDVNFTVDIEYYMQEGVRAGYSGNIWSLTDYYFSKRYTYNIYAPGDEHHETPIDTYYIWELYTTDIPDYKTYIINNRGNIDATIDDFYDVCDADDPDKVLQIGSTWYKVSTEASFLFNGRRLGWTPKLERYFTITGFDNGDSNPMPYEYDRRSQTFNLVAESGKSVFQYKILSFDTTPGVLTYSSDLPGVEPGDLIPELFECYKTTRPPQSKIVMIDDRQNVPLDIKVTGYELDDADEYFHYSSDKKAKEIIVDVDGIQGDYIGHCIANNYLVVFSRYNNEDYIYRILANNNNYSAKLLFRGNLGLSTDSPIETLYYYESDDIQKVYWVDGINQTRVINIMKEDYINSYNDQFDFVPSIRKVPNVSITKEYKAIGNFHSGVIQFFLTYYNKFGAETKIVYGSPLNYISFQDRAGAADEFCSCSFNIKISNIDTKFDYLRLYSVKRQSLDGPLEVNIVSDIRIADRETINIVDTGANQAAVDSNMIYFLGGSNFVAQTLAQKDDTLFLGNIELKDSVVNPHLKEYIRNNWITDGDIKEANHITFDYKCFTNAQPSGFYPFKQQIDYSSITFKSFKFGEIYRFGIQYQDKSGTWTQPIWIGDKKCTLHPKHINRDNQIAVPTAIFKLTNQDTSSQYIEYTSNYVGYRLVMANTDSNSRSVLAQGIVCPTMFNYKQRVENKPYSFASYIMRPRNSNVEYKHFYPVEEIFGVKKKLLPIKEKTTDTIPIVDVNKVYAEFYVGAIKTWSGTAPISLMFGVPIPVLMYGLSSFCYMYVEDSNDNRSNGVLLWDYSPKCSAYTNKICYEDMMNSLRNIIGYSYTAYETNSAFLSRDECNEMHNDGTAPTGWTYYESQSTAFGELRIYKKTVEIINYTNDDLYNIYLKLIGESYNPLPEEVPAAFDNEFYVDESILTLNSPDLMANFNQINQSGLNFRLVGIAPITSNYADFDLTLDENSRYLHPGNIVDNVSNEYTCENISSYPCTLFNDFLYSGAYFNHDAFSNYDKYRIYMWHHTGSIIGYEDNTYGPQEIISSKTFSNRRFSVGTEYFNENINIPISKPEMFNEDNIALKKIQLQSKFGNYYGNYTNSLVMDPSGSLIERTGTIGMNENGEEIIGKFGDAKETKAPVDIRFSSTPHAVFSLYGKVKISNKEKSAMYLLPRLKSDYKYVDYTDYAFGDNTNSNIYIDNIVNIVGIIHRTSKTLLEDFKDFINRYGHGGTGDIIMTSSSPVSSELPNINGIYKVCPNPVDGYSFVSCYSDNSNSVFNISYQGDYKSLENYNYNGTVLTKFSVNTYTGELIQVDNLLKPYIRSSTINYTCKYPYLFIGELYREIPYSTLYGGYDDNALENITWIPISNISNILSSINKTEGDTYYQRWDCVKTTPFNTPGINSVIDVTSVFIESHYCLDGRWDKNRNNADIININTDNYNLFNDVYSQQNNIFSYNILDDKYDLDTFKNLIIWSRQKLPIDDIDTWTNISQLNSLYLDGEFGGINKLVNFNDTIIAFQDKAIAGIKFNNNIQISTEQGSPIEVVNSDKVTGCDYITKINGCINKWSIITGSSGLFFIDSLNKSIFRINKDGLTNLSASLGFSDWSKDNISLNKWTINTNAFRTSSDKITHDVYFINNNKCLCYNEDTQTFTSFYTEYANTISMFNLNGKSYYLDKDLKIHEMFTGDYLRNFSIEFNVNPEPLEDKIFTNVEYISDTVDDMEKQRVNPFKTLIVTTEYQNGQTNLLNNKYPNAATKFRIWRADVPRDSVNKLDRIRNPWARFKLEGNDNISGMTTLHTLTVKYFK